VIKRTSVGGQNVGDVERVGHPGWPCNAGRRCRGAAAAVMAAAFLGAGVALTASQGGVRSIQYRRDIPRWSGDDGRVCACMVDAGHDRRRCDVGAAWAEAAVSPPRFPTTLACARHADPFGARTA
jgi:hypothetical protein